MIFTTRNTYLYIKKVSLLVISYEICVVILILTVFFGLTTNYYQPVNLVWFLKWIDVVFRWFLPINLLNCVLLKKKVCGKKSVCSRKLQCSFGIDNKLFPTIIHTKSFPWNISEKENMVVEHVLTMACEIFYCPQIKKPITTTPSFALVCIDSVHLEYIFRADTNAYVQL